MNIRTLIFSSAATGVLCLALLGGGGVFAAPVEVPAPASPVSAEVDEAEEAGDPEPVSLPAEAEVPAPVDNPEPAPSGCVGSGCGGVEEEPEPVVEGCAEGEIEVEGECWASDYDPSQDAVDGSEAFCENGRTVDEQLAWLEESGYVLRANEDPCDPFGPVEDGATETLLPEETVEVTPAAE